MVRPQVGTAVLKGLSAPVRLYRYDLEVAADAFACGVSPQYIQ